MSSRYSSTRPAAASVRTSSPLPSTVRSVSRLSSATAAATSPRSSTEFCQGSGSVSVVEATYLVAASSAAVNGLPSVCFGQNPEKSSYVRRPSSSAPPAEPMSCPRKRPRTSSLYGWNQPPWSNPPRWSSSGRPGACITPSRLRFSITRMRPTLASIVRTGPSSTVRTMGPARSVAVPRRDWVGGMSVHDFSMLFPDGSGRSLSD